MSSASLIALPTEILLKIFPLPSFQDVIAISHTCSRFRSIILAFAGQLFLHTANSHLLPIPIGHTITSLAKSSPLKILESACRATRLRSKLSARTYAMTRKPISPKQGEPSHWHLDPFASPQTLQVLPDLVWIYLRQDNLLAAYIPSVKVFCEFSWFEPSMFHLGPTVTGLDCNILGYGDGEEAEIYVASATSTCRTEGRMDERSHISVDTFYFNRTTSNLRRGETVCSLTLPPMAFPSRVELRGSLIVLFSVGDPIIRVCNWRSKSKAQFIAPDVTLTDVKLNPVREDSLLLTWMTSSDDGETETVLRDIQLPSYLINDDAPNPTASQPQLWPPLRMKMVAGHISFKTSGNNMYVNYRPAFHGSTDLIFDVQAKGQAPPLPLDGDDDGAEEADEDEIINIEDAEDDDEWVDEDDYDAEAIARASRITYTAIARTVMRSTSSGEKMRFARVEPLIPHPDIPGMPIKIPATLPSPAPMRATIEFSCRGIESPVIGTNKYSFLYLLQVPDMTLTDPREVTRYGNGSGWIRLDVPKIFKKAYSGFYHLGWFDVVNGRLGIFARETLYVVEY
ncbi:hypothetical protein SISSUDRAFT_1131427 [Sistotremastrum suecicum HHB10207 ss-3]|uniref:F-box domain-containing protein n=1 Tax=Sistotremastrum suecicum HHB10207 ss-3 TaxID=1314776 RepID=A0A166A6A9_9AGAM|nr:hypothetical protein SISSUDRAFT_1131427 [Sistotremastrum suecicum HHB10207 ss-3]